jgi:glycosyltransferase involved in cell wall biosynthesis
VKKILHVVNISFVIPYYLGDQITFFEERGHTIYIACTKSENLFQYANKWKFIPFELNISRKISPLLDLYSILKLYFFIKKNKIDTVVGHTPKGALIAMISSYFANVNIRIYFRHGLMFETSKGFKKAILIFIERITSHFSTKVLCVSNSVLKGSINYNLSKKNKLNIINSGTCNGIDSLKLFNKALINPELRLEIYQKYNFSKTTKIIGYIGRLAKDKGINELILAWNKLNKDNLDIKLMLCGPIDERDPIDEELFRRINSDNSIIVVGEVKKPELFYSIFTCFVLPSYREGFPTVVLEASSMQLPVITTKSTGCIDSIIENETGIFAEISALSLSEKILFYINNPSIAKLHGNNGRDFVLKYFQQEKQWNSLHQIYLNA